MIEERNGRKDGNSGYARVFDNQELGVLLSKIQATVISNGNELERIILSKTNNVENLDEFIDCVSAGGQPDGIYVCSKKSIKKSRYAGISSTNAKGIEPDLLVFVVAKMRVSKVIELKDGDTFDTKKVIGEKEHLVDFAKEFGSRIPFITEHYICCFNQDNRDEIVNGMKRAFSRDEVLTGREFCDIIGVKYDEVLAIRKKDAERNMTYFIDELLKIEAISSGIKKRLLVDRRNTGL